MRLLFLSACLVLPGCVSTAVHLATLPVRATSQGVDWLTTSQDEADRNRGRRMRKQEAHDRREQRRAEREARREAEAR